MHNPFLEAHPEYVSQEKEARYPSRCRRLPRSMVLASPRWTRPYKAKMVKLGERAPSKKGISELGLSGFMIPQKRRPWNDRAYRSAYINEAVFP